MRLINIPAPAADELNISWVPRVAIVNCITMPQLRSRMLAAQNYYYLPFVPDNIFSECICESLRHSGRDVSDDLIDRLSMDAIINLFELDINVFKNIAFGPYYCPLCVREDIESIEWFFSMKLNLPND